MRLESNSGSFQVKALHIGPPASGHEHDIGLDYLLLTVGKHSHR